MAIETPVQVLQRLRDTAKRERLARAAAPAEQFARARRPREKASAFGAQIGTALAEAFRPEQDLEEDPAVQQARKRAEWLNVAPDDIEGMKANIAAATEGQDYEVANYLTDLYFKARTLGLKEQEIAKGDAPPKPRDLKSGLGKEMQDVAQLRQEGRHAEADELEAKVQESQAAIEAEARAKQMKTYDTALSNTFGVNISPEDDVLSHELVGPQYQNIVESAYDINQATGQPISKIRNQLKKYFDYDEPSVWTSASNEGFRLSQKAKDDLKAGKVDYGYDENTGRYGLYSLDKKGNYTGLISYLDERLVPKEER